MGGVRWLSLKENASDFSLLIPPNLVLAYSSLSICTLFWFSSFLYAFPYLYGPLHTCAGLYKTTYFTTFLLPSQLGRPKICSTDSLPWLCLVFLTWNNIGYFSPKVKMSILSFNLCNSLLHWNCNWYFRKDILVCISSLTFSYNINFYIFFTFFFLATVFFDVYLYKNFFATESYGTKLVKLILPRLSWAQ